MARTKQRTRLQDFLVTPGDELRGEDAPTAGGTGSSIPLTAGDNPVVAASGGGGDVLLTSGSVTDVGSTGDAGDIVLTPGLAAGTGADGNLVFSYATWPIVDGAFGEVLTTDGAGGLSWGAAVTRVRQQSDFGTPVGGVITVTDGTYYLANDVVLDDGVSLVLDSTLSSRVCLRADGVNTQLRGRVNAGGALVSFPNQGVLSHISVINEGSGDVVDIAARTSTTIDANANFAFIFDANIVSPSDFSPSAALIRIHGDDSGREPPRVKINNTNIGSVATEGSIVLQDGRADFLDISNTLLPAPAGPSLLLASNFDGFFFGGSILGGTIGAIPGQPAFTVDPLATILVPGSTRLFLVESVNVAGTLSGVTVADTDVLFVGNQGIRNSLFVAAGAFTGNAVATTYGASGVFVPIVGTLVASPSQQRWSLASNEFTFEGNSPLDAFISWSASFTATAGSPIIAFRVEVRPDGGIFAPVVNSELDTESTNRQNTAAGIASFEVNPLDTVRVTIANLDTTQSTVVNTLQVRINAT